MSLKLPYGAFNPITPQQGQSKISDRLPNSLFGQLKKNMKESMATDIFANTGPYKGIVLRVDKPTGAYAPDDYVSRFFEDVKGQVPNTIVVKVRIPEIHAHLPVPEEFGSDDGPHQEVINLYPDFVFQGADVAPIAPEDIVVVDFIDKKNMKGGVVVNSDTSTVAPGLVCSPRDSFSSTPPLMAESPQGDSIGASGGNGKPMLKQPSPKISNTDPNSGVQSGGNSGVYSDRIMIQEDYKYKVPFSTTNFDSSSNTDISEQQGNMDSGIANDNEDSVSNQLKNDLSNRVNMEMTDGSKSMIMYAKSLGTTKYMRTPKDAIRRLKKSGIDTVFLEAIWQGPPEGDINSPEQKTYAINQLQTFSRAFSKSGISLFLWGRVNSGMSRHFVEYIFGLAKKLGALGVIINPDISYAIDQSSIVEDYNLYNPSNNQITDSVLRARSIAELTKTKAKEFKLLSGVILPWFARFDRIRGPDDLVAKNATVRSAQNAFPYEAFYGFDIYLIDAKWNNQQRQFGASQGSSGLSLVQLDGTITEEISDTIRSIDRPMVAREYRAFIAGGKVVYEKGENNPNLNDFLEYQPNNKIYSSRQNIEANEDKYHEYGCLHFRLNRGEAFFERGVQVTTHDHDVSLSPEIPVPEDLESKSRNYIPIISVGGAGFYNDSDISPGCVVDGTKTPVFLAKEVREFCKQNQTGVSIVKSMCFSSWKECGVHADSFTMTR